jgi:O-antigen/teichoic acid export membrane protein
MGYKKDALKGVSWMTLLRGITRLLTFVRLAILGRLLTPTQFGYFGIASIMLAFLEILTETGINVFLVQEKSHIKNYVSSAWVVSILRGIILSLAIFLLAPIIVHFFNAPKAVTVVQLTAIIPFIRGFINPAIVTYQKELLFHKEFGLRSFLFSIEVIFSVVAAFILKNAQSFTWGLIASAIVEVTFSYVLIPIWPKFELEVEKVKHVLRRGWWVTVTGIFFYLAENGDNITVGRIMGSASLGIYQVAYKFSTLPISEITNVVTLVLFPVFTKFSDDKPRLRNAFFKTTLVTTIGSILLGATIFLLAKPLIFLFMGSQWLAAVPAIQILSIYGVLRTMFGNFSPLYLSVGKQNYDATTTLIRLVGLLIVIIPLVRMFGMVGAGIGMLISILIEIPVTLYFARKVLY